MGNPAIQQCINDLKSILKSIISICRMWNDLEGGKIMRRQVRDQKGRLVGKIFRVEDIVGQGEDWKVATVIDEDTMQRCTLKMLTKNDNICKSQIVNEIKNQKKMSGRPNFIELKAVYQDASLIYLLMELWGIPLEKVLARRRALMEREVQLIFCQLVDILQNLRSGNISHGNIALHSVLLASGKDNIIQLTDFTHSYDISADEGRFDKTSNKGSEHQSRAKWAENTVSHEEIDDDSNPILKSGSKEINQYISPQQYYDDKNVNKISYERDIWACGVLLFKLLTGLFPFTGEGGKLILNKIRFATFSFPSLDETKAALQDEIQCHFKSKNNHGFLSTHWKELLKRMLSVKSQRITLKELINHPFKLAYFNLKDIPNLKNSQPQLNLLFSIQPKKKDDLFKKSWGINYEQDEEPNEAEVGDQNSMIDIEKMTYKRRNVQHINENKNISRESIRTGTAFEKSKDAQASYVQVKNFRLHKTQFGFGGDSTKSIQNPRHETMGGMKEKMRKQKEFSLYTPMSSKADHSKMPQLVKEPPFIIKFKVFKRSNCLGYILNNSVGVIFEDGEHVIGHTKDEYRYIQQLPEEGSQILIDNTDCVNNNVKGAKQSIYKSQSKKIFNFRNNKEDSVKIPVARPKPNFLSQQVSVKNLDGNGPSKYTTSNIIECKYKNESLSRQKLNIFLKTLEHFGQRVVKGALDIWIDRYWRNGNIFVFLLNTGCWQVAFCEIKGFRIYAIDQYDLSWSKDQASSDVIHCVREIISKYEPKQQNRAKKVEKQKN